MINEERKFPLPYKVGRCLLTGMLIPYIIDEEGRGVCFWALDGGVACLGNVCSDFEEEDENWNTITDNQTA